MQYLWIWECVIPLLAVLIYAFLSLLTRRTDENEMPGYAVLREYLQTESPVVAVTDESTDAGASLGDPDEAASLHGKPSEIQPLLSCRTTVLTSGQLNKYTLLEQGAAQNRELVSSPNACQNPIAVAPRIGKRNSKRRAASLEKQLQRALAEIERLHQQLGEEQRASQRSAAPFSQGDPKTRPQSAGRQPGAAYRQQAPPAVPNRDRQIQLPLRRCPHCHGPVILKNTLPQFQEDIVRMTIIRRYDAKVGTCACCGREAPGAALGAGKVRAGSEALSMVRNQESGSPHGRPARVLEPGDGLLKWSCEGACRALEWLRNLSAGTCRQLRGALR